MIWFGRITALIVFGLLAAGRSSAAEFFFLELDGPLLEDRASRDGAFDTPLVLKKRTGRISVLEKLPAGPPEVLVTQEELGKIKHLLALDRNQTGDRSVRFRSKFGQDFYPGDYFLDSFESYVFLRKGSSSGENHLLRFWNEANQRSLMGQGKWQGSFWPILKEKTFAGRQSEVYIISDRAHSREEWASFSTALVQQRYLTAPLPKENVFFLGSPEFEVLGRDPIERKVSLLYRIALREIERIPLKESDLRLNANGNEFTKSHLMVIAEPNQKVLADLIRELGKIVSGRFVPIKIVFLNDGTDEEVKSSGRARAFVMTSDGKTRKVTPAELKSDLAPLADLELLKTNRVSSDSDRVIQNKASSAANAKRNPQVSRTSKPAPLSRGIKCFQL